MLEMTQRNEEREIVRSDVRRSERKLTLRRGKTCLLISIEKSTKEIDTAFCEM